MSSPIPGVAPATLKEVTVMVVWPSIAATAWGRFWGRRFENDLGISVFGIPITVGRIVALLSIPFILPVYFHMLVPRLPFVFFGIVNDSCRRYRLTNRRVIIEHPFRGGEMQSVSLDRFDTIDVDVLSGQQWYNAGDLVFRNGPIETLRLTGVPRPQSFRHTCLKAQMSFVGVQDARSKGVAV